MPDINIQFHAVPEEVGEWIRKWIDREKISVVAISFTPFETQRVESGDIDSIISDLAIRRLSLVIGSPDISATSQHEFDEKHGEQMILDVGHLTRDGLAQSWLACRTENIAAFKVWRKIASDVRENTAAGVTCINRQNGAADLVKSFRYTEAAELLQSQGVPMLPPQGPNGPKLRLGGVTT